jgi:hypothetical protein
MMEEVWKRLEGCSYEVSNLGRVRNTKVIRGIKNRVVKPFYCRSGYLQVDLHTDAKRRRFYVHVLVANLFCEKKGDGKLEVNHKDGKKDNNSSPNLEWVTRSANQKHAVENGLRRPPKGSEVSRSKLTEKIVSKICILFDEGVTNKAIADSFGVHPGVISGIRCGKSWKHVTSKYLQKTSRETFNDYPVARSTPKWAETRVPVR